LSSHGQKCRTQGLGLRRRANAHGIIVWDAELKLCSKMQRIWGA